MGTRAQARRVITVTLPLPESINHSHTPAGGGRRRLSDKSTAFFRRATEVLMAARAEGRIPPRIIRDGLWHASARIYQQQASGDADNRNKQGLDAIQARATGVAGAQGAERPGAERFAVLDDDARICVAGPFYRFLDPDDPRMELTLTEIVPGDPEYAGLLHGLPPRLHPAGQKPKRVRRPRAPKPEMPAGPTWTG